MRREGSEEGAALGSQGVGCSGKPHRRMPSELTPQALSTQSGHTEDKPIRKPFPTSVPGPLTSTFQSSEEGVLLGGHRAAELLVPGHFQNPG